MKRKLFIRIGIIIAIVLVVSFSDWSFAENESNNIKDIAYILNFFTEVFSWIWVIFAKFAGEFLTNKWVYGEILGLDSLLWQYWVVVRNMSNLGLGLFFTYTILTAIFKKEDISKKLKDTFLWLLIAGIGIQVSWFLTAVVLDASTITLVTVGSFPSQVISKDPNLERNFKNPLAGYLDKEAVVRGKELILFPKGGRASNYLQETTITLENENQITEKEFLDDLLPKYDNVSGPLYYMGISILDTFSASKLSVKDTGEPGLKETILNTVINGGTTIVFSIEMAVLCVIAILRIFYLWMFIVLSPFVILLYCVKKADPEGRGKRIDSSLKTFTDNLNIKSFFINAFRPTIIVLGISISVIFLSAMKGVVMTGEPVKFQGVTLSSSCPDTNPKKCETHVDSPLFGGVFKNLSKTFMELIISIITIILVYMIIKYSIGIGKGDDFVSKKANKLQDNIGELITSTPVIPVTGYDEKGLPKQNYISLGSSLGIGGRKTITEQKIENMSEHWKDKTRSQTDEIMKAMGFGDSNTLTEVEKGNIDKAGNMKSGLASLVDKREAIKKIKSEDGKGMTLDENARDGGYWKNSFGNWLSAQNGNIPEETLNLVSNSTYRDAWKKMAEKWKALDEENMSLDQKYQALFTDSNNRNAVAAYADFFGLGSINSWVDLKNKDISQGTSAGSSTGDSTGTSTGDSTGTSTGDSTGKQPGTLKETLSASDFNTAFAGKESIQQSAGSNNCYLVAAVNLIARNPKFETLMRSSIRKDKNNYIIRLPLGEPGGTEYTVTPAELKMATIKGGGDGYKALEIGYMKRVLGKENINSADVSRMDGGSTVMALNNLLGGEGFEGSVITSGGDGSNPLSVLTNKNDVVNNLLNYNVGNGTKILSASSLPGSDTNTYKIGSHTLYNGHAYPILSVANQGNDITGITVLDPMNSGSRGEMTLTKDEFFKAFRSLDIGRYTSSFLNSATDQSKMEIIDTKDR